MKRRIPWSLFLPSALALAAAAGLCVLLWMQQDAFEESFLKLAKHDIRLLTQDATDELSALLENDDFEAVRQYAEDVRHAGIRVIVLDSAGKVIVNAGDRRKNKESLRREFVETLTNGEFIVIRPTEELGEYRLYSSRKVADHVVQLTIPYGQAKEPMKLAFYGEILSALAGLLVALSVFLVVRQFLRRINALAAVREEQARRLEEAVAGKAVALTPGEYRLLELLVTRSGRIHTRGSILDAIQVETKDVSDRTVDVMLAHMRPKLGEWATHIETVRGVGYRLVQ